MGVEPYPVVAVCTSAGGLAALTSVLAPLPVDFPAAIIALQHQDPFRPSILATLLRHRCVLPVRDVIDHAALEPGVIHVVPPGTHLIIGRDERVRLLHAGVLPPARPSADLLLCTAAVALGARLIAVILTGGGHDGAIGAEAARAFGGRVLVQNPLTAFASGMPAAAMAHNAAPPIELADIATRLCVLVAEPDALAAGAAHG